MKNSTMLFLSTIAMIGSFSVIKTEFSPEEMIKVENFAKKALKKTIELCDENKEYEDRCTSKSDYSKNQNAFLSATQVMTPTQTNALIDTYIDKAQEKAAKPNCINCRFFADDLKNSKALFNKAIEIGRGNLPTHQVIALDYTERGLDEAKIGNLTIKEFIATQDDLPEDQLADLQGMGDDNLTIYQVMALKCEAKLREDLGLAQNTK